MKPSPKRVTHIITGLATGGAEKMLTKLVCASDSQSYETVVISLTDKGTLGQNISDCNIKVYSLEMSSGRPSIGALLRLVKLIRHLEPDLIMSWMYHASIVRTLVFKSANSNFMEY